MADKYDVGILGVWYGCNYGSIATYYSLYYAVKNLGKSVLMIHRPWLKPYDEKAMEKRHSMKFARKHYDISKSYQVDDMKELNEICDTFLLGSDQLWNYGITKTFGHSYFLDFAADTKNKVAYATSFGADRFLAPSDYAWKALRCMRRMNAISVREEINVNMCRKLFGVKAAHVLDPVLLNNSSCLSEIAETSERAKKENYIAAYILDPTPEKREALLYLAEKMNKELVVMLDGWPHLFQKNKEKMGLDAYVEKDIAVNDWLFYIKNSDFVVTDSFHGTCMAILFERQFYAISNAGRGAARFESLMRDFDLFSHYVRNPVEIMNLDIEQKVDYHQVLETLNMQRQRSMEWLKQTICPNERKRSVIDRKQILYPLRMLKSIALYENKGIIKKILRR